MNGEESFLVYLKGAVKMIETNAGETSASEQIDNILVGVRGVHVEPNVVGMLRNKFDSL